MTLVISKNCKTCAQIVKEKPPKRAITASKLYRLVQEMQFGRISASVISKQYPQLGYKNNVLNHAKNHQVLTDEERAKDTIQVSDVEELRAEVMSLKDRVFGMEQTKSDINELTSWLMDEVKKGNVKPSLGPLVNLVGKAAQISEKEIDQKIGMVGLMAKYASGEVKQLKEDKDGSD